MYAICMWAASSQLSGLHIFPIRTTVDHHIVLPVQRIAVSQLHVILLNLSIFASGTRRVHYHTTPFDPREHPRMKLVSSYILLLCDCGLGLASLDGGNDSPQNDARNQFPAELDDNCIPGLVLDHSEYFQNDSHDGPLSSLPNWSLRPALDLIHNDILPRGDSVSNITNISRPPDPNSTDSRIHGPNDATTGWWEDWIVDMWAGDHVQLDLSTIGLPSRLEDGYANDDDSKSESDRPWIQLGSTSTLALLCSLTTDNQQGPDAPDPEASAEQMDEDYDPTSNPEGDADMADARDVEAHTVQVVQDLEFTSRDQNLWQELRIKRSQVRSKREAAFAMRIQCRAADKLVVNHQSNASIDDMLANLEEVNFLRDQLGPLEEELDELENELELLENKLYRPLDINGNEDPDFDDSSDCQPTFDTLEVVVPDLLEPLQPDDVSLSTTVVTHELSTLLPPTTTTISPPSLPRQYRCQYCSKIFERSCELR
ncbi:hypothetical protein BDZ45DRAFT_739103 [Acephala macrosclerotiorum]|nr:hypothetical protein BDZ45DRAFT_739103 [Acephala macrosclerotiorum]